MKTEEVCRAARCSRDDLATWVDMGLVEVPDVRKPSGRTSKHVHRPKGTQSRPLVAHYGERARQQAGICASVERLGGTLDDAALALLIVSLLPDNATWARRALTRYIDCYSPDSLYAATLRRDATPERVTSYAARHGLDERQARLLNGTPRPHGTLTNERGASIPLDETRLPNVSTQRLTQALTLASDTQLTRAVTSANALLLFGFQYVLYPGLRSAWPSEPDSMIVALHLLPGFTFLGQVSIARAIRLPIILILLAEIVAPEPNTKRAYQLDRILSMHLTLPRKDTQRVDASAEKDIRQAITFIEHSESSILHLLAERLPEINSSVAHPA